MFYITVDNAAAVFTLLKESIQKSQKMPKTKRGNTANDSSWYASSTLLCWGYVEQNTNKFSLQISTEN
jgi:hypothetical protein